MDTSTIRSDCVSKLSENEISFPPVDQSTILNFIENLEKNRSYSNFHFENKCNFKKIVMNNWNKNISYNRFGNP